MSTPRIYLAAAEASGDRLGAGLVQALRRRRDDIALAGIGGHFMRAEGIESPFDITELSVLGLIEGLKAYPRVVARVRDAVADILEFDPDVVVLIDSWGFTLRVAQALRRAGSRARLIKYIGPQVWASRAGRAKTLARTVDRLLCIYDIETPYYAPYGLPCTVVGNPVANAPTRKGDGGAFRAEHGFAEDAPLLLILFGSRPAEVTRLGDDFVATANMLQARNASLRLATFVAPAVRDLVAPLLQRLPGITAITEEPQKEDVFKAATAALVCSGSVTTEVALQGTPMVVAYRLGAITWFVVKKFLVKARFATLLNIAADKEVVPEFLQRDCTPERLSAALHNLLTNAPAHDAQVREQEHALDIMGRGKPSAAEIAADAVLEEARV